jgi:hypothetical protein
LRTAGRSKTFVRSPCTPAPPRPSRTVRTDQTLQSWVVDSGGLAVKVEANEQQTFASFFSQIRPKLVETGVVEAKEERTKSCIREGV